MTGDEDVFPLAVSYVFTYAWNCPECYAINDTGDVDEAGSDDVCTDCGITVTITT